MDGSSLATTGDYFTRDQIELVKTQIAKGASDGELKLFLRTCERLKLDPFARQIFCVKRWTKDGDVCSTQVSIDGFRVVAERTGQYEGQTVPMFCGADGVWKDVWLGAGLMAARVGVYRKGFREPVVAVARWDSFVQTTKNGIGPMWMKMPDIMLAKCAEAQALRKAFPNDLSGIYSTDEMQQVDSIDAQVVSSTTAPAEKREEKTAPTMQVAPRPSGEKVPHQLPKITTPEMFATWAMQWGPAASKDPKNAVHVETAAKRLGIDVAEALTAAGFAPPVPAVLGYDPETGEVPPDQEPPTP